MLARNIFPRTILLLSATFFLNAAANAADIDGKWIFQKFTCAGGEEAQTPKFSKYKHEISFDKESFQASIEQVVKEKGKKISCNIHSKGSFSVKDDQLTIDILDSTTKGPKDCKSNKGMYTSEFQVQNDELRIAVPTQDGHPYCPKSKALQLYTKKKT